MIPIANAKHRQIFNEVRNKAKEIVKHAHTHVVIWLNNRLKTLFNKNSVYFFL